MAKVKIQGHASGTGILTVTAPNTSTDRTITLPDATGTLLTADGDGSSLTGVGVDGISSSADATAITIDAAENVGFGVTPTTYYSGYTGVQIGTNGTLYGQTAAGADNNFWVGQNVRAGTDGSEKAITTGVSSQMMQSGGHILFKTAASASADANVSWTTNLNIKADGRGLSQFTAKAWVNFSGEGTVAINDSHNVSSITDDGTGKYTVNFSNALGNANYAVTAQTEDGGGYNDPRITNHENSQSRTTTAYGLYHWHIGSSVLDDATKMNVIVFGD